MRVHAFYEVFFRGRKDEMSQRQYSQQPPETREFAVEVGSSGPLPPLICSLRKLTGRRVIA